MYTGNADVPDDVFTDVLKQISDFVRNRVGPRELEIAATDAIPDDLRSQAAEMGLFGYAIPQEWGGLGLDLVQDVEVAMELGYTSLSLRSMFGTNNGIAGQVLVGFGTDEQRKRWLPGIASGEIVASFALTEPGAGSNPAGLRTTATRDGEEWVIEGGKQFITNATEAGLFVVFARTHAATESSTGIAVFLVPAVVVVFLTTIVTCTLPHRSACPRLPVNAFLATMIFFAPSAAICRVICGTVSEPSVACPPVIATASLNRIL